MSRGKGRRIAARNRDREGGQASRGERQRNSPPTGPASPTVAAGRGVRGDGQVMERRKRLFEENYILPLCAIEGVTGAEEAFNSISDFCVLGKNMLHSHRGSRCATTA